MRHLNCQLSNCVTFRVLYSNLDVSTVPLGICICRCFTLLSRTGRFTFITKMALLIVSYFHLDCAPNVSAVKRAQSHESVAEMINRAISHPKVHKVTLVCHIVLN